MAMCNRNGVIYKRHQFKDDVCKACGEDRREPLNDEEIGGDAEPIDEILNPSS